MNPYSWEALCLQALNICGGGSASSIGGGISSGNPSGSVGAGAGELGCPATVDWFWVLAGVMGVALLVAPRKK